MADSQLSEIIAALQQQMPAAMRWAGTIARRLRGFDIALEGKSSGSANTDALTLADLSLQEMLVAALRDGSRVLRQCRIEAEESTGDLHRFTTHGQYVISIDPIDGTKQYRDRTANGYCVMLHLRDAETVHYSLVYLPESRPDGEWVEVVGERIVCGPDDPDRPAREVLDGIAPTVPAARPDSPRIYLIGFQQRDVERAESVTNIGLWGIPPDDMPGSIYPLLATGEFGGSLIHSPNVYDFPVALHIARVLGGDALWVHNRQSVNFHETWNDDRADMLRLPGIVACSTNSRTLVKLCELAKDWSPQRYES